MGVFQFCATADAAPSAPGAYILQVDIAENALVTIAGRSPTELTAGCYLYCGSANGPGGLRARLARHMRHGKSVHWHIDQLTECGIVVGSWIVPNGRQCELVAMLGSLPMPIPGFGSSDCRRCRSHLLYRPTGVSVPLTGLNESHLDLANNLRLAPSFDPRQCARIDLIAQEGPIMAKLKKRAKGQQRNRVTARESLAAG